MSWPFNMFYFTCILGCSYFIFEMTNFKREQKSDNNMI